MTKVRAPLFSRAAQGSIAKKLSYYSHRGITAVKSTPVMPVAFTPLQQEHRWHYQNCVAHWHTLTDAQKEYWASQISIRTWTPFNAFLDYWLSKPPALLARYHFDRILSSQALDSSNKRNHATVYGASLVEGRILSAFNLDGIDDYVQALGAQLPIGNSSRTIHIWVKSQNLAFDGFPYIFYYGDLGEGHYVGLYGEIGSKRLWFDAMAMGFDTGIVLDDLDWHLLTVTYDGTYVRVYDNGVLGSGSPAEWPLDTILGEWGLIIGSWMFFGDYWKGPLDEFIAYDYCQTPAQIALYL